MRTLALGWALLAGSAVVMASVAAKANVYDFDFTTISGPDFTVTGQVTTSNSLDSVGGYDILSITGQVIGPGGGYNYRDLNLIPISRTSRLQATASGFLTMWLLSRRLTSTIMVFCSTRAARNTIFIRRDLVHTFCLPIIRTAYITPARRDSRCFRSRALDVGDDAIWLSRLGLRGSPPANSATVWLCGSSGLGHIRSEAQTG